MRRELREAFEEARPYLQKPKEVLDVLKEDPSEEEIEEKIEELMKEDSILATDLKIVLSYLRR